VHCFNIDFNADDVDNYRKSYHRREPMGLRLSIVISRTLKAINSTKVCSGSVPYSENNPSPEDFQIKVLALLSSFINNRVLIYEFIVYILVYHVRKEALPGGPDSVIHRRENVREEHLSTVTIFLSEPDLSENKQNVLIEVIADQEGNSAVTPSTVHKNKSQ